MKSNQEVPSLIAPVTCSRDEYIRLQSIAASAERCVGQRIVNGRRLRVSTRTEHQSEVDGVGYKQWTEKLMIVYVDDRVALQARRIVEGYDEYEGRTESLYEDPWTVDEVPSSFRGIEELEPIIRSYLESEQNEQTRSVPATTST
jgi:hypothetical protein